MFLPKKINLETRFGLAFWSLFFSVGSNTFGRNVKSTFGLEINGFLGLVDEGPAEVTTERFF